MKKNERERERVLNVNEEYRRLQEALGLRADSRKVNGRLRTLTAAISYIQALKAELEESKGETNKPTMASAQRDCAGDGEVSCVVVDAVYSA